MFRPRFTSQLAATGVAPGDLRQCSGRLGVRPLTCFMADSFKILRCRETISCVESSIYDVRYPIWADRSSAIAKENATLAMGVARAAAPCLISTSPAKRLMAQRISCVVARLGKAFGTPFPGRLIWSRSYSCIQVFGRLVRPKNTATAQELVRIEP